MQVACGQCGARYEFDAAIIPAGGYDAQCTNCQSVFFVGQEEPEKTVTVSCPDCAAAYQFAASAIPPGGYDAQCTQCQSIFFVSQDTAQNLSDDRPALQEYQSPEPQALETIDSIDSIDEIEPMEVMEVMDSEPLPLAQPPKAPEDCVQPTAAVAASALTVAAVPSFATATPKALGPDASPLNDAEQTAHEAAEDLLALSMQLGDPEDVNGSAQDDFELILQKQKRRRVTFAGGFVIVFLGLLGLYAFLPTVFDRTVGPLIGVKAAVHPAAIPLMQAGRQELWGDTEESYGKAMAHFDAALAIDPLYPEALALQALAYVFRGIEQHEAGRRAYDEGVLAVQELKALQREKKSKNPSPAMALLQQRIEASNSLSTELFEAAGKETTQGLERLGKALAQFQNHPMVLVAAGIYYTQDKDRLSQAREFLYRAVEIIEKKPNQHHAAEPWLSFLRGRVAELAEKQTKAVPEKARAAYEQALAHTAGFQRARYRLASMAERADSLEQAQRWAEEIIEAVPTHVGAKALIGRLSESRASPADEPVAATEPALGKSKKRPPESRRKQKRRGRRR